jgi:hypothetical protein
LSEVIGATKDAALYNNFLVGKAPLSRKREMNEVRQFELLETLRPYGSARAVLLRWNGQKYVPTQEEIEVFEFVGTHGERHNRGYARFSNESRKWEAVGGLQEPAESWLPF